MGAEPEKITQRYPNVFAVTGPQQYESVVEAVHRAAPPAHDPFVVLVPPEGIQLTPRPYASLKIYECCTPPTLRAAFMGGFPGETEADFEMLLDWLGEAQLDRVGCFKYEPVAGAVANDLAAPVPDEGKAERWNAFMQRQQAISAKRLKAKVGTRQQVIIDEVGATVAKGRTKGDAPEIDGAVYVASRRPLRVGEIATVKIARVDEYDLHGMAVGF